MNNQDVERFKHQVEDMYSLLLNISSDLLTIKTMMKSTHGNMVALNSSVPGMVPGGGVGGVGGGINAMSTVSTTAAKDPLDAAVATTAPTTGNGAINHGTSGGVRMSSMDKTGSTERILSPQTLNRMSFSGSSSHVVASTTITNLDSSSQKLKLVSIPPLKIASNVTNRKHNNWFVTLQEDIESPVANIPRSSSGVNSPSPYAPASARPTCSPVSNSQTI